MTEDRVDDNLRIGVYVCHCGSNIAGVVDTAEVGQLLFPRQSHLCCGQGIRHRMHFRCDPAGIDSKEHDADRDGDGPGRTWQIDTLAGRIVPELLPDGTIRVDMGAPFLEPAQVPTNLPVGNPAVYVGLVNAGMVVFVGLPLIINALKKPEWKQDID